MGVFILFMSISKEAKYFKCLGPTATFLARWRNSDNGWTVRVWVRPSSYLTDAHLSPGSSPTYVDTFPCFTWVSNAGEWVSGEVMIHTPVEQAPSHLLPPPFRVPGVKKPDLEGPKSPWSDLLHALK